MSATTEVFTGLRPTGQLTLGNYLGAIKPMVELQEQYGHITMFIADLHGLTDQEPSTIAEHRLDIAADYLALGLDPEKSTMFVQSAIKEQVLYMAMLLSRHMTMAEIMRVPTLKDKLKNPDHPEQASVMLANYPLMMAADILLQSAKRVPVGEDQASHLEVTRLLARRFNGKYAEVLVEPETIQMDNARVLALDGEGKMSKSKPQAALLLSDTPEEAAAKIKRAETALEGQTTDVLQSHMHIVETLADDNRRGQLEDIRQRHQSGQKVMGEFKQLFTETVQAFLRDYQAKREEYLKDETRLVQLLENGNQKARENADRVIAEVEAALGLTERL